MTINCSFNTFCIILVVQKYSGDCYMAMTVLQTRVDSETKLAAENLFSSLGLDITTAIRLFLRC